VTVRTGREWLVILEPGGDASRVEAAAEITQRAGTRTLIAAAEDVRALRSLPGVRAITEADIDSAWLEDLSESERLFANAFAAKHAMKNKRRPGEGLDWDAEGMDPP